MTGGKMPCPFFWKNCSLPLMPSGQRRMESGRLAIPGRERMPAVYQTIGRLPVQAVMLDGELVALRDDGVSSFPGLPTALKTGRDDKLFFYVFDLLHLNGWDLRGCTLLERTLPSSTVASRR